MLGGGRRAILRLLHKELQTTRLIVRLREWQDPNRLEQLAVDAALGEFGHSFRYPQRLRFAPLIAWITRTTGRPVLIILDQFEEYFLYRDKSRMQALEQAFGNLIARRDLPLHVLVVLRDDALHQLDQLRAFALEFWTQRSNYAAWTMLESRRRSMVRLGVLQREL